ncbi:MAG: FHA domain-containing protein [Proteobacteria bacterium]|nr:FHA domain-containing protein [Pseudomonadota bacterium]
MSKSSCPMIARSDWGVGSIQQKGMGNSLSLNQSTIGFHGPRTAGWLVFMNGAHRGEDIRVPVGESKLGSGWNNDVVLTGVGIGSQHAILRLGVDEGNIAPTSEARIVSLNNRRIQSSTELVDGALVTFGDLHAVFRYAAGFAIGYRPADYQKPESMPSQSAPKLMTCGWLVNLKGVLTGRDYRLVNGLNRVGSEKNLEVTIPEQNFASIGFSLSCSTSGCLIQSVQAERALKVNGRLTELGAPLRDSDIISFDHLELLVKWL